MSTSLKGQAAQTSSLHQLRQALLRRLGRVNRRIAMTQEQLQRLEERMAGLAQGKAA